MAYDPGEPYTLDEADLHSNAGWSPYHAMRLPGRVVLTVSRGEVIWDGTRPFRAAAGAGHRCRASRDRDGDD